MGFEFRNLGSFFDLFRLENVIVCLYSLINLKLLVTLSSYHVGYCCTASIVSEGLYLRSLLMKPQMFGEKRLLAPSFIELIPNPTNARLTTCWGEMDGGTTTAH